MKLNRAISCFLVAAAAVFLGAWASPALADDCTLLGGAINGSGECEISTAVAKTGTFNLDETLHVTGTGRIDASNVSNVGITLNICVAPATPSASCDLVLDTPNPLVTPPAIGGGQIEADDVTGNDNASPITIKVSRDILMGPSSAILADNTVSGGKGGTITITAGRNMTMSSGATISSTGTGSAGNSPGGVIVINVGNYPNFPGVGVFTMDATAQVLANSPAASAGSVQITAGDSMDIEGLVQSSSRLSATTPATQAPGGGTLTLISGCKLTVGDTGKVSSEGKDPGADLVHLEGCQVDIFGIVQSIAVLAGGHAFPVNPPNHCNADTTAHPTFGPPSPPAAHPGRYTTCVEIWGNTITIDGTGTHNGQVIADGVRTDTSGPMRSWIDIFAKSDINIIANTTKYAVQANPDTSTNEYAGLITIKSQNGKIVTSAAVAGTKGLAIQANATSAGSKGGDIIVQSGGASPNGQVDFTADSIQAIGASSGGGPAGGHITVQSFNDTVAGISPGELNAGGGSGATVGTVTLTACVGDPAATYAGTVTGTETDNGPGVCGGSPSFPTVPNFITGLTPTDLFTNRTLLWGACTNLPTISGQKFNDLNGNGTKDPGDTGVSGFQIHIFDKATSGSTLHQDILTDGSGNYTFTVPAGEYIVCEQGGPSPNSPAQTYPASDGSGGACQTHTGVTGSRGYDIVLTAGQNVTGQDFGNFFGGGSGTISGQKFNDVAGDGVKDAGDPPVPGFQIHLFDKATAGSTVHQDTLTDASGNYSFTVPPGEYIICEQGGPAPASPAQTFPASDASGGACATHTSVANSRGYDVVLSSGQNVTGQDFGNFFAGSISGQKFNDLAGDGVKDAGDPPISGIQIHLLDKATSGTIVHLHMLTDGSGNYSFGSLQPGEYIVCEQGGPAPASPAQTFPASDSTGGICATHTGVAGSRGYDVVLTANQAVTAQDFGNFSGGTIGGQKFNDLAGDGVKDAGDPPVSGVQIHLLDKATGGSTVHQHTSTDASGNYSFGPLQPGEYIVCEQGGPAPNSPAQTFPASDSSGGVCASHTGVAGSRGYDIVLGANQTVTSQDFGNFYGGTISGHKFSDNNGNGAEDAGDTPVAGLQIHLFDKATGGTSYHQHQSTDANGDYSFTAVPPGEYILCEQGGPGTSTPQTFPASDGSGGACATHTGLAGSRGYDIVLTANQTVTGFNFGNDPNLPPPPPPPPPKAQIPTLDDFALLALAALLGMSGAFAVQRRRVRVPSPRR